MTTCVTVPPPPHAQGAHPHGLVFCFSVHHLPRNRLCHTHHPGPRNRLQGHTKQLLYSVGFVQGNIHNNLNFQHKQTPFIEQLYYFRNHNTANIHTQVYWRNLFPATADTLRAGRAAAAKP